MKLTCIVSRLANGKWLARPRRRAAFSLTVGLCRSAMEAHGLSASGRTSVRRAR
jgi:hypothetical protein